MLTGALANGGRFSCGAEVRHRTILNGSAAWPRGGLWSGEPRPWGAVSYKRWLERSLREVAVHKPGDRRGSQQEQGGNRPECQGLFGAAHIAAGTHPDGALQAKATLRQAISQEQERDAHREGLQERQSFGVHRELVGEGAL